MEFQLNNNEHFSIVKGGNSINLDVPVTPLTYNDLLALRNNNGLIPGHWYRITDYVTTTTQSDTRSAGHVFDVIVRADEVNILNENAFAAKHSGDTYFANSNLAAWELKYCLDNDTDRFSWADDTNGKGVIYYMKDEFNNECPYDFKNIQYKRYICTDIQDKTFTNLYGDESTFETRLEVVVTNSINRFIRSDQILTPTSADANILEKAEDWVYRLLDYTSDAFKSASDSILANSITTSDSAFRVSPYYDSNGRYACVVLRKQNKFVWLYTFSYNADYTGDWSSDYDIQPEDTIIDSSLQQRYDDKYIYENKIESCDDGHSLNNIVFLGDYCYSNTFGTDGSYNVLGNGCQNNTFENNCYSNTFGNNCCYNTFGNECSYNTFGNECSSNTFGNECYFNTFENGCCNNTFGNECYFNTFENGCSDNTLAANDKGNHFGENCSNITFSKVYTYYAEVGAGNSFITLTSTGTTSDANELRNITIAKGVNNSSTTKTISHNTLNDTFQTTYQDSNSTVVNV